MGKEKATRKEIFNSVWLYIKKQNLMHKNLITLDEQLKELFTPEDQEDNFIAVENVGIQLKNHCNFEDYIEIDVDCENLQKKISCVETIYELPMDEVKSCMAFFAEKLYFDENEKKIIL